MPLCDQNLPDAGVDSCCSQAGAGPGTAEDWRAPAAERRRDGRRGEDVIDVTADTPGTILIFTSDAFHIWSMVMVALHTTVEC